MTEADIKHIYEDIEFIKRDLAEIKQILSAETELTDEAKQRLKEARSTPDSEYVDHEELKKKILG
tara:strand:+ start:601 stop:795 length:195 start_codon:yes stop_codon:yes gene_type:complete